jgi:hypothetical protein
MSGHATLAMSPCKCIRAPSQAKLAPAGPRPYVATSNVVHYGARVSARHVFRPGFQKTKESGGLACRRTLSECSGGCMPHAVT